MQQEYKRAGFFVNKSSCLIDEILTCTLSSMNYGQRLRSARKLAGLTQAGLSDAVHNIISQQGIQYLENSDATGSEYTAQLAHACGVRAMWLAAEQGEMVDGLYVEDPIIKAALSDPRLIRAMIMMESLPSYAVDHVIKDIAETQELINQAGEIKRLTA